MATTASPPPLPRWSRPNGSRLHRPGMATKEVSCGRKGALNGCRLFAGPERAAEDAPSWQAGLVACGPTVAKAECSARMERARERRQATPTTLPS